MIHDLVEGSSPGCLFQFLPVSCSAQCCYVKLCWHRVCTLWCHPVMMFDHDNSWLCSRSTSRGGWQSRSLWWLCSDKHVLWVQGWRQYWVHHHCCSRYPHYVVHTLYKDHHGSEEERTIVWHCHKLTWNCWYRVLHKICDTQWYVYLFWFLFIFSKLWKDLSSINRILKLSVFGTILTLSLYNERRWSGSHGE